MAKWRERPAPGYGEIQVCKMGTREMVRQIGRRKSKSSVRQNHELVKVSTEQGGGAAFAIDR